MSIGNQKNANEAVVVSCKVKPEQAELLNTICNAMGCNTYSILQWFISVLIRSASPMHRLSPDIQKLMMLMQSDYGWSEAFNQVCPDELRLSQLVMIMEQQDHRGFGAVMVNKPFMGQATQTENAATIIERTIEVCAPGIYNSLRRLMAQMQISNVLDLLTTMIDAQTIAELQAEDQAEMAGEAMFDLKGRRIEYGKRTKVHQHRTPDSYAEDGRLRFDDIDHDAPAPKTEEWEGLQHDT